MRGTHVAVVWPKPTPWTRAKLLQDLRKRLKGRVEQAYLIGSHARKRATEFSDVDLILIAATSLPWADRFRAFEDLWSKHKALDLLIYTPEEWDRFREAPSAFLREAKRSWVRIL